MANLDSPERVLCVPRATFERVAAGIVPPPGMPDLTGFLPLRGDRAAEPGRVLFATAGLLPRTEGLERDESFRQIIPYVLLRKSAPDSAGALWHWYTRPGNGGEGRLAFKRSLGLGGHVNAGDLRPGASAHEAALTCAYRELREEAGLDPGTDFRRVTLAGLVADQRDPVGRVHVGLVFVADLAPHAFPGRLDGIDAQGFSTAAELAALGGWEGWSELLVDARESWSVP